MQALKKSKKILLPDGTPIYCLRATEAIVLDDHIKGYLKHGISLKNGDVVLDVGANIGVFGIRVSQWFENIELHCFEPVPAIFEILTKNAALSNNPKFHVYQKGLGSKNEILKFSYFPNSPALSTSNPELWEDDPKKFSTAVKGSMKNSPSSMWWTKLIPNFLIPLIAWYLTRGKTIVESEVITLSSALDQLKINRIDLLKLDCEGHEMEVLKGISNQHWNIIHAIVMEIHDIEGRVEKTKELLSSKGFNKLVLEKEKALEDTELINLYALK